MEKTICGTKDCVLPISEGSDYCQGCNALGRGDNWLKNNGGKSMTAVTKIKPCIECKKNFQPRSNRTVMCDDCKKNSKKALNTAYRKKNTNPKPEIPANLNSCEVVKFTDYPELYTYLLELAKQEYRTPAMQILKILQTVKDKGEEQI